MIWAIGDIHGMFDPLKNLITKLEQLSYSSPDFEIEKIIFIGDYIDRGPSTKEVVDFIVNLPFKKVCLLGNHEIMLLQFLHPMYSLQKYYWPWLQRNGGDATFKSYFPKTFFSTEITSLTAKDFPLNEQHQSFFESLKLFHFEKIAGFKFVFVHAGFQNHRKFHLETTLNNFSEYLAYINSGNTEVRETLLWTRAEATGRFENNILVNGHTPTISSEKYYQNAGNYKPDSLMPLLNFANGNLHFKKGFPGAIPFRSENQFSDLLQINIDTAAVYGGALTAMGFSETLLKQNKLCVCQAFSSNNFNSNDGIRSFEIEMKD